MIFPYNKWQVFNLEICLPGFCLRVLRFYKESVVNLRRWAVIDISHIWCFVQEEKHKVAALKNAYVLMGKHRHEMAAAFFILGQDINSAAVICAKNMGDPQLALTICILLEGPNGPIGRDIILKYALPTARKAGDGWLASLLQV